MQSLTVYIATACLGAMLFFSFVLAPLIFGRLPAQQAGTFAAGVAGNYFRPDGLPTSSLVLAEFVLSLFVLIPAINRAKDRELQGAPAAAGSSNTCTFPALRSTWPAAPLPSSSVCGKTPGPRRSADDDQSSRPNNNLRPQDPSSVKVPISIVLRVH